MRLALLAFSIASLQAGNFRASAAKVDITPTDSQWLMGYAARQSTGVHDRIYHRIVAMDDGTTQFFLVSSELCVFSPVVYDEVAVELKQQLGIAPQHFWWTVTHTHSAPEMGAPDVYNILLKGRSDHEWSRSYASMVKAKLVEGIKEARSKLIAAKMGIGTGSANANVNRRAVDIDGKVSLGMNPDGPVDRQLGLIRIEKLDGGLLALVSNYAMHGTVLGGKWLEVSGDGPGMVSDYVEKKLGAPVLFINGAAGNIAPIYSVYDTTRAGHLSQFGVLLGDKILATHRNIATVDAPVKLTAREFILETPLREGLSWDPLLVRYGSTIAGKPTVKIPIRFLKLNDLAMWGAPLELFCEVAIDVRNRSPFRHTFYFGYANGWLGYLPTAEAFKQGGYEPATSLVTSEAAAQLRTLVSATLDSL